MARYTGPRCKLCRREMTPMMLKGQRCLTDKCPLKGDKKYPPGPPRKRRTKMSDYAVQLREKQRIKRTYGLLEKPFRLNFEEANRMKGVTGENMLSLLERRLDNVVYRAGFASSRSQARQFVQHNHIAVNGRVVNIASFIVKDGDSVEVVEKFKTNAALEDAVKLAKAIDSKPEWIDVDYEAKVAKVTRIPVRTDIKENFNEQLVVELYSK
ncbi:MAG TPA: 30S ribosomal protein S4 [Spirochaetota bacterium]|nr:30S ribosomal protein S4 [Spirochaetota bacterium]OQB00388.1 MAG: 30S ribosomal protein S4 [Spirochaetes bacterium ADurb.Bin218]HOK02233.1 30S ribosomal protein S4 [Spirochaetota bacterium]HOK93180.1 30S ribosomal protein S4 [Spirochaetota bacterium]HOQ10759.1 30S ribosomal protein S4 [Spirochaetota bacterium]